MKLPYLAAPGRLTQRVQLQTKTVTRSAAGGMVESWEPLATVWAGINHLSGLERGATTQAGGEVAVARTEIVVRYRPGITAALRAVHGSTVYNIRHVNDLKERHEWLLLTCEAGGTRG